MGTTDNIFITDIYIKELRHLKDVTIPITTPEKGMRHLILTGKNGSGKTSLLEAMALVFDKTLEMRKLGEEAIKEHKENVLDKLLINNQNAFENALENVMPTLWERVNIELFLNVNPTQVSKKILSKEILAVFFEAKRVFHIDKSESIENIILPEISDTKTNNSKNFLKYLVFLRSRLTDAYYTKKEEQVKQLEDWFSNFEALLKEIYDDSNLTLEYESKNLDFNILLSNKNRFDFNHLSDGFAAILRIVTEIMLRIEAIKENAYGINGIVLIDEIEAHLHIELQKKILPFLTKLFPNIQFIVSTHSPFILNSIENAVVYDLETGLHFEDPSELSVSGLIENYFLVKSDYSTLMDKKINDFETLVAKGERTDAEDERLADLLSDLKTLSPLLSPEMYLRFTAAQKKLLKPVKANA